MATIISVLSVEHRICIFSIFSIDASCLDDSVKRRKEKKRGHLYQVLNALEKSIYNLRLQHGRSEINVPISHENIQNGVGH